MKLTISQTVFEEVEPAIEDAVKNRANGTPDQTDPVYLKIHEAQWKRSGIVIDADDMDVAELRSRALYKIEVAQENMSDDPRFWRGQLAAWRGLLNRIAKASAAEKSI